MTLLKNDQALLPLASGALRIYAENMEPASLAPYAIVVGSAEEADLAIIRLATPWYPVETDNPMARGFHHGDLDFKGARRKAILELARAVPTVVVIYLDRPAVIPEIAAGAAAVIADFGASDRTVAEVLFGVAKPEGRLPFELPSSMEAVRNQLPDVPADSADPLFAKGYGLDYKN